MNLKKQHTYKPGRIDKCQICGNKSLHDLLNLGFQPLADDLKPFKFNINETIFYPLNIKLCKMCLLAQTNYIINDKKLYPRNYHYRPGITKDIISNFKNLSKISAINSQKIFINDVDSELINIENINLMK